MSLTEDNIDFDELLNHITFPKEVQEAIDQIVPSNDPLDQADFNAVDYINALFPTEKSLSNLDDVILNLETKITDIDNEIRCVIRKQTDVSQDGQSALEEARQVIHQLLAHADRIRSQAEQSDNTVREITRDIKQLDAAKKNLTTAITTLNHLHMLVAGVDALQVLTKNRQYGEIILPLQGITEVMEHFRNYLDVPQVAELSSQVQDIRERLAQQITQDFHDVFPEAKHGIPFTQLSEACKVVSVLDADVRNNLLKWFTGLQLAEYIHLFQETQDCAMLDKIDKRYAWIKRHLLDFEDKVGHIFPTEWEVSERITVEFCKITRNDLSKIMEKHAKEIDVKLLLFAIQRTDNFENLLAKRFTGSTLRPDSLPVVAFEELPKSSEPKSLNPFEDQDSEDSSNKTAVAPHSFHGIIGQCFEPHLHIYVQSLDRNLSDLMERFVQDSKQHLGNQDSFETEASVLPSCADLFVFYKKCLVQCSQLSTSTTMLNLAHTFQKYLREYALNVLQNNLPKISTLSTSLTSSVSSTFARSEITAGLIQNFQTLLKEGEVPRLNTGEQKRICCILTTAEYCWETAQQLEDKLKEKIDKKLATKIDLSQEQDIFLNVISNCIQLLVQDLECACDAALVAMTKMNWQAVESVGDQSPYVTAITGHLKTTVPVIRDQLASSRKYFTQFCVKFATVFYPKFIAALYKCRSISTVGAEQLLLDTHSLKTVLLEMPSIGSQIQRKAPVSYTKVVVKGMEKAEMILKVVMAPIDSRPSFIDQVSRLMPDIDQIEFQKLLEMKGVRKSDQQNLLKMLPPASRPVPKIASHSIEKLQQLMKRQ